MPLRNGSESDLTVMPINRRTLLLKFLAVSPDLHSVHRPYEMTGAFSHEREDLRHGSAVRWIPIRKVGQGTVRRQHQYLSDSSRSTRRCRFEQAKVSAVYDGNVRIPFCIVLDEFPLAKRTLLTDVGKLFARCSAVTLRIVIRGETPK